MSNLDDVMREIQKGMSQFEELEKKVKEMQEEKKSKELDRKEDFFETEVYRKLSSFSEFYDIIHFKTTIQTDLLDMYKKKLFLAIQYGVHILIEGKERSFNTSEDNFFLEKNEATKKITVEDYVNTKTLPDYFYFSSNENAEKSKEILSNFFGVNLLDWWY